MMVINITWCVYFSWILSGQNCIEALWIDKRVTGLGMRWYLTKQVGSSLLLEFSSTRKLHTYLVENSVNLFLLENTDKPATFKKKHHSHWVQTIMSKQFASTYYIKVQWICIAQYFWVKMFILNSISMWTVYKRLALGISFSINSGLTL